MPKASVLERLARNASPHLPEFLAHAFLNLTNLQEIQPQEYSPEVEELIVQAFERILELDDEGALLGLKVTTLPNGFTYNSKRHPEKKFPYAFRLPTYAATDYIAYSLADLGLVGEVDGADILHVAVASGYEGQYAARKPVSLQKYQKPLG